MVHEARYGRIKKLNDVTWGSKTAFLIPRIRCSSHMCIETANLEWQADTLRHLMGITCVSGNAGGTALVLSLAGAFVPQDTFGVTGGCYSLLSILSPTTGSNRIVALNLAQIILDLACPCLCWRGLRGYCRLMSTAPLYKEYARGQGGSWLCTATISSL